MRHTKILSIFFLLLSLLLNACTNPASQSNNGRLSAQVVEVIDGDTIKARLHNKTVTIRFLLVDTPETHHPKLGKQPFGEEAHQFTRKLLEGKTVELEQDVSPGPDKYGRYLYYVYVDGKSVQEMLLANGLARVAYVYVPNVKYVDRYRAIEAEARQKGIGIWSLEDYVREDGYHPARQPDRPGCSDPRIKGNINKQGDKIYHLPGSPSYAETKAEVWFCTEKEAMEAGFRKAKK